MIIHKTTKNLDYYKFENLCNYNGLTHFVSTRLGGVSSAPYNFLNLGLKVDDKKEDVMHNRLILADAVGINISNFAIPSQCHSNNITIVSENNRGMGVYEKDHAISDTDALVTNIKQICLMIFAADCVPVILFDPVKKVIAVAHAGWKGTVNRIVRDVIICMAENFGINPQDIIAGIGPSIGPCCYNVGTEVIEKAISVYGKNNTVLINNTGTGNVVFDLWQANKINLMDAGIPEDNIETAQLCTSCHSELFFSHRKSGGNTGRFGAGIMLQ